MVVLHETSDMATEALLHPLSGHECLSLVLKDAQFNVEYFGTETDGTYSTELLAILSKVAAIYVQRFNDSETVRAAGDIEDLTVGLSRNIWQKIMILDRVNE